MTALAAALLLIFILHLIDKHGLWRKAFKITLCTAACLLVLGVVVYGWMRYSEKREEARVAAENEAYKAKMTTIWDCEARNAQFSNAREACEKDPSVILQPIVTADPFKPTKPAKPFGNARIVPDYAPLFGCSSSTLITTVYHGSRVKILSHESSGQVRVQIPDGRTGCLLENDDVQPDRSP